MIARRAKVGLLLAVAVLGVAADQAVKGAAFGWLEGRPAVVLAGGVVRCDAIQNRGAVLGVGSSLSPGRRVVLFTIVECALLAVLAGYAVIAQAVSRSELFAVALVVAGALGNVLDRIALGYVRDYVMIGIPGLPTAVFNLADVLVVAGGVLLLVVALRSRRGRAATAAAMAAALVGVSSAHAQATPRPFAVRMVKLGGPLGDPATEAHIANSRKLGFNAVYVEGGVAGRWTSEAARRGPSVDRAFARFARSCRERGMDVWVSVNPMAETGGRFVFSNPDGARRIAAFAKKLHAETGIAGFVLSFADQPVELREFQDIARFGLSAAPAHLELARRIAADAPPGLAVWLQAAAYCDAHLGDGTRPYAKAYLHGLETLPPSIGVVWAGARVMSPTVTGEELLATRARLGGRPLLLYDNFPANDDDEGDALALILGGLRGRDAGVRDAVAAYLACPMSELGGSRFSLATTAAYLADPEGYDPDAAVRREVAALSASDPDLRLALDTQQLEWGGFIDGRNYWPRDALNAPAAGKRLDDPAFVESFTWTADRYPGRLATLSKLSDREFRDDLLRAMRRRLVVARALPVVREYDARKRAGRADAAEALAEIEAQRRSTASDRDASRILDLFLRAAGVPVS